MERIKVLTTALAKLEANNGNFNDPVTLLQAVERFGGSQLVYDPNVEKYVATENRSQKGAERYFPVFNEVIFRGIDGASSVDSETAKKRLTSKFVKAMEEDVDLADTFVDWVKSGKPVEQSGKALEVNVPSPAYLFVSKSYDKARKEAETARSTDKEKRTEARQAKRGGTDSDSMPATGESRKTTKAGKRRTVKVASK
jgi:hypothetical protein